MSRVLSDDEMIEAFKAACAEAGYPSVELRVKGEKRWSVRGVPADVVAKASQILSGPGTGRRITFHDRTPA